jgi:glycerate 2-kinase
MRFLIAPNAFKGTIDASTASEIIEDALKPNYPNSFFRKLPIADGGDGTCQLLTQVLGLEQVKTLALNPIGRPVLGNFGWDRFHQTAYIDVSTVSGIHFLKESEKNPWVCSTYGTGELILTAIDLGAKKIVLGLGGSASIDLGFGILRALGFLFLDKLGREIAVFSEHFLEKLAHIQRPIKLPSLYFSLMCDVENLFFGEEGAIPVFGPQKGIKEEEIDDFTQICKNAWQLLEKKIRHPILDISSFGAAGGVAIGLSAFFPCEIKKGAAYFFEQVNIEKHIKEADWIITGEGKYDEQSAGGKGSYELMKMAKKHGKKITLITSELNATDHGFDQVILLPSLDFETIDYKEKAKHNLFGASKIIKFIS